MFPPRKKEILLKKLRNIYYLDLPIWNLALSGFNAELDCVIFIDSEFDMTHL